MLEFIRHPFGYVKNTRSSRDVFRNGIMLARRTAGSWRLPGAVLFARDLLYTILWIIEEKCQFDLYVGADPLNCFAGLVLRRLGRVETVVFYTIDYVPRRFQNPILNQLYRALDTYCVAAADFTWNLSPRISEARRRSLGPRKNPRREVTVPIGVWLDRIRPVPLSQVTRNSLVFMGHLRPGQGAEMMVRSMPKIIETVPDSKLVIIGTGPLENELKELVVKLGLKERVMFKGFVEDHVKVEELLTKCAIGIAPYEPDAENFTYYTDPGKPKLYLACGLPVIITKVPWIAELVHSRELGVVVGFNEDELATAAILLMTDAHFYARCRKNALAYARELDWNYVFQSAFENIRKALSSSRISLADY